MNIVNIFGLDLDLARVCENSQIRAKHSHSMQGRASTRLDLNFWGIVWARFRQGIRHIRTTIGFIFLRFWKLLVGCFRELSVCAGPDRRMRGIVARPSNPPISPIQGRELWCGTI